jgi:hypothetical protein
VGGCVGARARPTQPHMWVGRESTGRVIAADNPVTFGGRVQASHICCHKCLFEWRVGMFFIYLRSDLYLGKMYHAESLSQVRDLLYDCFDGVRKPNAVIFDTSCRLWVMMKLDRLNWPAWMQTKFFVDRFHYKFNHSNSDYFCRIACSMDNDEDFRGRFNSRYVSSSCTNHSSSSHSHRLSKDGTNLLGLLWELEIATHC